jgi:hypothetical protein
VSDTEDPTLKERLDAVDELAVNTAKRLTTHMTSSTAVHRDLKARVSALELLVADLIRQRP